MIYLLAALALVVLVLTLWFTLRPLARGGEAQAREEFQQLQLVRERLLTQLNEIDIEERDRNMDGDVAAAERLRLEAELAAVLKRLDAAASVETASEAASSDLGWQATVVGITVFVPLAAVALYWVNATVSPLKLERIASMPAQAPQPAFSPEQMVARLEQRLKDNPNDADGWLLLGRSYAVLSRLPEARDAYAKAYAMLPKNYEPQSADALWFLGLAAYEKSDFKRAVDYWTILLEGIPADSEPAKQLRENIEKAKRKGK